MNYQTWLDELTDEIEPETWCISTDCTEDFSYDINEWATFIHKAFQIRKNKFKSSNIINYLWHDCQACQLRFSTLINGGDKLPFGCIYEIISSPNSIIEMWLSEPNYLPWSSINEITNNSLSEDDGNIEFILNVYVDK